MADGKSAEMRLRRRLKCALAASPVTAAIADALARFASLLLRPWTRRREARNRAALAAFSGDGKLLCGQGLAPLAPLPFAGRDFARSGCGVLAAYNALQALGAPEPLAETAAWFARYGSMADGALGVNPRAFPRFFKARGLAVRTLRRQKDPDAPDRAFADADAAVFTFWNDAARLRLGAHSVALLHAPDGGILVCNATNRSAAPERFASIRAYTESRNLLPVSLCLPARPCNPGPGSV